MADLSKAKRYLYAAYRELKSVVGEDGSSVCAIGTARGYITLALDEISTEQASQASQDKYEQAISEALNMGDGAYRP
jgi:hypothetical protein